MYASELGPLTPRQTEVVKLVALGFSSKEIAYKLNIGFKTATSHRYEAMQKTLSRNTADMTRYAIREHLIEP